MKPLLKKVTLQWAQECYVRALAHFWGKVRGGEHNLIHSRFFPRREVELFLEDNLKLLSNVPWARVWTSQCTGVDFTVQMEFSSTALLLWKGSNRGVSVSKNQPCTHTLPTLAHWFPFSLDDPCYKSNLAHPSCSLFFIFTQWSLLLIVHWLQGTHATHLEVPTMMLLTLTSFVFTT
jgi:hypothetical protein